MDLSNRRDKGDDLDAVGDLQVLLGDGTSSDTADGLTSRRASSTGRGLDTILLEVGVVGVRGARVEVGLGVVVGALVLVADLEGDRRAEGDTVLDTGVDDDKVLLVTRSGQVGLAGTTASELGLDVSLDELHALRSGDYVSRHYRIGRLSLTHRGDTIDNGTDRRAVGFTIGGDTEDATESRHGSSVGLS